LTTVLVVGMAVVDFLFEVDTMPRAAEKYRAHDASMVGGGGAANAACAVARLGGHAQLAARVGDDLMGNIIVDDLKHHNVDCSSVMITKGARSSYSSVLIDNSGERQIVNFRGCGLSDDTGGIESARPAAVLTDTRWTSGAVAVAFSRQGLESIAGTLNSVEGVESALREASGRYNAWVAMTDGDNGVYSWHNGELRHQAAMLVEVADS